MGSVLGKKWLNTVPWDWDRGIIMERLVSGVLHNCSYGVHLPRQEISSCVLLGHVTFRAKILAKLLCITSDTMTSPTNNWVSGLEYEEYFYCVFSLWKLALEDQKTSIPCHAYNILIFSCHDACKCTPKSFQEYRGGLILSFRLPLHKLFLNIIHITLDQKDEESGQ